MGNILNNCPNTGLSLSQINFQNLEQSCVKPINIYLGVTLTSSSSRTSILYLTDISNIVIKSFDLEFNYTGATSIHYNIKQKKWICTAKGNSANRFAIGNSNSWNTITTQTNPFYTSGNKFIDSNQDFYLSVTTNTTSAPSIICYSNDGNNWTNINGISNIDQYEAGSSVRYGNNKFVVTLYPKSQTAVSKPSILISNKINPTNGSDWISKNIFNVKCLSVEYGNNIWIVIGNHNNRLCCSISNDNTATWSGIIIVNNTDNYSDRAQIFYGNNLWIITDGSSYYKSSNNGSSWSALSPPTNISSLNGAKYIKDTWYFYGIGNSFAKTKDFKTWTYITIPLNMRVNSLSSDYIL